MGTLYRSSSASTRRISHPTLVPCVVSALPVSAPRGTFPPLPTHRSRLTPCSMVSISTPPSPVLASRTFALTSSVAPLSQSRRSSVMLSLTRAQLTRLSLSVAPPVFQRSRSRSPTTSTARSHVAPSTLTRLLHTAPLSRPTFSLVVPLATKTSFCWTSPLFPWVSRPLVAS